MTEQAPTPERITDDQLIAAGLRFAELNVTDIPDSTARRIANQWHGGQTSALYSLASSGAIRSRELETELWICHQVIPGWDLDPIWNDAAANPKTLALDALASYIENKGDRGAVDDWARTTDDGLPPAINLDGSTQPRGTHVGTYETKRELVEYIARTTGVDAALEMLADKHIGRHMAQFVIFDRAAFEAQLHELVIFVPLLDDTFDAFWR